MVFASCDGVAVAFAGDGDDALMASFIERVATQWPRVDCTPT